MTHPAKIVTPNEAIIYPVSTQVEVIKATKPENAKTAVTMELFFDFLDHCGGGCSSKTSAL